MKTTFTTWLLLFIAVLFVSTACNNSPNKTVSEDLSKTSWDTIGQRAQGQNLQMVMWQGDPLINAYMNNYVKPQLQKQHGINLNISAGQGSKIVSLLMNEMQANSGASEVDMVWINGETFYQLRQIEALYGPFLEQLPNAQYLDLANPMIANDFQQPIGGMEAPWGNVQMTVIYNSQAVPQPPKNLEELSAFVKANPGKFTIPTEFTGMTLLKSWLMALAGKETLQGDFKEELYQKYSDSLFTWINAHRPYFWKQGETFPESLAQMHQMFANGELYFTFSNNDSEVDNKIVQGIFPNWARAYVYESGTIQNSHYLGIVKNAAHKEAALVAINFLLSPQAQLQKFKPQVWGDGTTLSLEALPEEYQQQFEAVKARSYAPSRDSLNPYALPELAPEYTVRLYDDFRKKVLETNA
jgi:putative spermidine/putrescine transport system substrate-binding protein